MSSKCSSECVVARGCARRLRSRGASFIVHTGCVSQRCETCFCDDVLMRDTASATKGKYERATAYTKNIVRACRECPCVEGGRGGGGGGETSLGSAAVNRGSAQDAGLPSGRDQFENCSVEFGENRPTSPQSTGRDLFENAIGATKFSLSRCTPARRHGGCFSELRREQVPQTKQWCLTCDQKVVNGTV